jgi:hypothetical protein
VATGVDEGVGLGRGALGLEAGVGLTICGGTEDEPELPEVTVNVKSLVTIFPAESVMVIVTV